MNFYTLLRLNKKIQNTNLKLIGIYILHLLGKRHLSIRIDPSLNCNLFCRMCYFSSMEQRKKMKGIIPEIDFASIAKVLFPKALQVYVGCGAEPTTHRNFMELVQLAKKYNVTPIATNDVHYLEIDDWLAHDIIIKTRFDKISSFKIDSHHFWLKSEKEMFDAGMPQEFLDNTQKIVAKCEFVLNDFEQVPYENTGSEDVEIKKGNAAYLSQLEFISSSKAIYYAENIIGKNHPDVVHYAERITGIPRKSSQNPNKIAYLPGIKEKIPLKISLGKIITQFTEDSCCRAGASIQPLVRSTLAEALLAAKKVLKKIIE